MFLQKHACDTTAQREKRPIEKEEREENWRERATEKLNNCR